MNNMYDVCIVGSGPAGAFAANRLAANGHRVLLIEAGGNYPSSDVNNNFDIKKSNIKNSVDFGFSQQIGGSSNLWAGGLAEMNSIDLISRPDFNSLSWPINDDDLKMLYKRVKEMIKYDATEINVDQKSLDYIKKISNISSIEFRHMMLMDKPFNTKNLLENKENIDILQNHTVFKVNLNNTNDDVKSLDVFNSKKSKVKNIRASRYILAAGAVSNIRILLHSFNHLEKSNPEFYDSIGRYFSTHPKGPVGKIKFKENIHSPFINIFPNKSGFTRYYLGIQKIELLKNKILNHSIRIESVYAMRMAKFLDYFKSIFGWMPIIGKNAFVLNIIVKIGISFFQLIEKLPAIKSMDGSFHVRGFFDQAAKKENKISLSSKKSLSGLPLAIIDWGFNDEDWDNVDNFMLNIKESMAQNNIGDFEYSRPLQKEFTGIHSHFIGGTRIGDSSNNSVVDKNLKVHGVNNLYISGPSVFPSFGYANPFLSIAALSLRLSDHLIDNHEGS